VSEWPQPQQGTPTLAALRHARAHRDAAQRWWMAAIALSAVALMIATAYRVQPGPGLHGASLGVTLALCGFIAGVVGVVRLIGRAPGSWAGQPSLFDLPGPVLLLMSSAGLVLLQPTGQGVIGLVIGVAVAARLIPGRPSTVVFAATLAFLVTDAVIRAGRQGSPGLIDALALTAVYSLVLSSRRFRQQEQQAERLLVELDKTRSAELRAAALAERQRLAREMHDVLAHSLSALAMQLEGARLLAESDPGASQLAGTLERAHQLARNGLDEARQAIGMLRDEDQPDPARLAAAFTTDTGIPCRFEVTGPPRELSSAVRLALYRVTQEALTNASKHASPDRVDVRLTYLLGELSLKVEDFGRPGTSGAGVGALAARTGYGLTGMRERAALLGGSMTATPTYTGFLVLLRIPA
jgi:signal transduction histidine kinase